MNADRRSRSGLAGAGALAIGAAILFTPLNAILSRPMVDWQLRRLAPAGAPEGVVVVDIDDPSIARLQDRFGTWPYRRDVYALAVETLRDLGASAIVFDLVFADALPGDEAFGIALAADGEVGRTQVDRRAEVDGSPVDEAVVAVQQAVGRWELRGTRSVRIERRARDRQVERLAGPSGAA